MPPKTSMQQMIERNKARMKSARAKSKERQREEKRLKSALEDEADPKLRAEARVFVENDALLTQLTESASSGAALLEIAVDATRKASTKETIEAVARAYAFWILSAFEPRFNHLASRAVKKRKRLHAKTTKLHLFVEAMISHGEDDQRLNRQLCNRNVQAIRWLNSQQIPPSEVLHLSRERGEGLDSWARRWAQRADVEPRSDPAEAVPPPKDDSQNVRPAAAPIPPTVDHQQSGGDEPAEQGPAEPTGQQHADIEIHWLDNLAGERRTFRFKRPTGKSAEGLSEIKLMLEQFGKTWSYHPAPRSDMQSP